MAKRKKQIKEEIARKKFLIQKYRKAFDIVKKHIDSLDLMGLLEIHCPKDEYDFEIIDIVRFAINTKDDEILADIIIRIFNESFNEDFNAQRDKIIVASKEILSELRKLNPIEKETYFISKDLLPGSCYFEFQQGKYKVGFASKMKLDNSLYLYGDDDGSFDYSAITPFTYLISGSHPNPKAAKSFDYCGITYINEIDGRELIKNLRGFAELLGNGKQIYEALIVLNLYAPNTNGSWQEEDSIKKLDLIILKNTAEVLADWAEKTLADYKWISVLGI